MNIIPSKLFEEEHMVECDWCGAMVPYEICHTYRAAGPYYDEMIVCPKCYANRTKREKEELSWESSKKEQKKKEN